MKANIKIVADSYYAKEIVESMKIDNVDIPKGMDIKMSYTKNQIIVELSIEVTSSKSILTLRNTADEILEQITLLNNLLQKKDR
ncbi:hypothetical protein DFR86_08895 [Acidianus sulfidivorans JP7]|uniref:KEOPS complex Pcc1-like subunit n=1 Tax=Acidianus sulfidivorans JP7 TaxID=619593 RepID=A0A2U9INV0_9CREN|nr:KEOPS complex subunit Pcc1 [Acidianus sulfidivorans]AWR97654.1 hypothetical protein DFR86_08895 [Acidianus sulfidivorans JP7]